MTTTTTTTSTSNKSAKTFTIRKNGSKYRTNNMTRSEFDSNLHNTSNDWNNFLKYSNDYFVVK